MGFEERGATASDDPPCHYGVSKLHCRGPRRDLDRPYLAFLGGSETYGRFVAQPFVTLLERASGRDCVNLGCLHAGLDAIGRDGDLLAVARGAERRVLQVPGLAGLSNRFYRVHPRRNDRFLQPTQALTDLYPEVDFTEFNYCNHALECLYRLSPQRFAQIRGDLAHSWDLRIRALLHDLGGDTLLMWLRPTPGQGDPVAVTADMVDALRPLASGVVEIAVTAAGPAGELEQMSFAPMQAPVAARMIGPATHRRIAAQLLEVLAR
ncbi:DUF6473 family protein [Pukyongiella litopenaei]|uniref:DUF6473 domain-containing protein n=1 Tax=Pukyongiella litopenaei TaxID=2605946 RepID=A0A2S0MR94_9RHOB|nr:DUF6473 family protein [Pukyongiella litopenaei]AVO38419.1 hypothetical protein C6Y53_12465 [Pukyongiella litopenaei]